MMHRFISIFLMLGFIAMLAACASGPPLGGQEPYRGQVAAGVVQPPGPEGDLIQRRLLAGLKPSDAFAGVYPLMSSTQSTEAEVLIEPVVLESRLGSRGFERLRLQVRAYQKNNRGNRFDKGYTGKAAGNRDALDDILKPLERDLKRRFGAKPVY